MTRVGEYDERLPLYVPKSIDGRKDGRASAAECGAIAPAPPEPPKQSGTLLALARILAALHIGRT